MGTPQTSREEAAAEFEQEETISRQQAAERLVDIAYALSAGGTLELVSADGRVKVPVADAVVLKRQSTATAAGVEILVVLSWSEGL
jgi:adenylate kinase